MRARAVLFDKDLRSKVEALDRSQAVIEFALDGTILAANTNFLDAVGYRLDEVRGQSHAMLVAPAFRETEAYRAFWAALRRGEFQVASSSAWARTVARSGCRRPTIRSSTDAASRSRSSCPASRQPPFGTAV